MASCHPDYLGRQGERMVASCLASSMKVDHKVRQDKNYDHYHPIGEEGRLVLLVAFEDRALLVLVLRAGRRNFEDPKREDRRLDLRDSHYWVPDIYFANFQQVLVLDT